MLKKLTIIATSVIFALSLAMATVISIAVASEQVPPLPDNAYVGDTIKIPEEQIDFEGEKVPASVVITSPSGGKFQGNALVVEEVGLYTVDYFATYNGATKSLPQKRIKAIRKPHDLFLLNEQATATDGAFIYNENYKGVRLAVSNGGLVTFDKIIDLTNLTKDDVLIEFIVEGSKEGSPDFTNLTITLTDVEDSDNVVNVSLVDSGTNYFGKGTYIKTGATGQVLTGYEGNTLHTNPQFGMAIRHTFKKQVDGYDYKTAKISFDYLSKTLYASDEYYAQEPTFAKIADLDSPADFATLWKGFTNGKVRLSISASGLSAATANLIVTKVLNFDLSCNDFNDVTAPELIVDLDGEKTPPVSYIGAKYKIFDVIATDDFDDLIKLSTDVFYRASVGADPIDVKVEDGYFTTSRVGIYTIEYQAVDRSGNLARKTIEVYCGIDEKQIEIQTDDVDQSVLAYDVVEIGGIETVQASGGNGNLSISVEVADPDGESVQLIKNQFVAYKVGEYTVKYLAKDYFGNENSVSVKITVTSPDKPIFIDDINLPERFMKGFKYNLPSAKAKEWVGGIESDAVVTLKANGVVTDGNITADGESVTVEYIADGESGETVYSKTIPVIDANNGKDQEKYFYGKGISSVTNEKDFVKAVFNEDSQLNFANLLQAHKFSLGFSFEENAKNFAVMEVKLTDSQNAKVSVTLKLTFNGNEISLTTPYSDIEGTFSASQGEYELAYNNSTLKIIDKNAQTCGTVEKDDNGNDFVGFSGGVYLSILFKGVTGDSSIQLISLNNQVLGYRTGRYENRRDRIEPQIFIAESYAVKNVFGQIAKVSAGSAFDVLGYVEEFSATVIAPDGSVVLDNVSAYESHEITLNQYGEYRLTYYALDSHGISYTETKLISVVERELPKLKVLKLADSFRVGETVTIPTYEVSDNSGVYCVDVILVMPNNEARLLIHDENGEKISKLNKDDTAYENAFKASENSFRLLKEGKYILRFFAYDENYNYVTVEFEFTVHGENG
ncbi:MAG: hypothetical protein IJY84_01265 [Clostridia bacterium]|nr:hypothetical protein [Clostridia bacterium]